MSITGMLTQQPAASASFLESIPTSVQTIVGMTAIAAAGWTWFLLPRITKEIADKFAELRKENQEAHAAIGDRIDALKADIAEIKADTARLAGAVDGART